MSVRLMDRVFHCSRSSGVPRLVLLALADVGDDSGEVSAYGRSVAVLMAKANASRSAVRRAIDTLVAIGELEVTESGDGRRSSCYRITLAPEGVQNDPPHDQEGARKEPPGGAKRTPRGREKNPQGARKEPPISPSSPVLFPSESVSAPPEPRAKRVRPRIEDQEFNATRAEYAHSVGMRNGTAQDQWERFVNWHAGHASKWRDWDRAWMNWCRNWRDRQEPQRERGGRPSPMGTAPIPSPLEMRRRLEAEAGRG